MLFSPVATTTAVISSCYTILKLETIINYIGREKAVNFAKATINYTTLHSKYMQHLFYNHHFEYAYNVLTKERFSK